MCSTDWTCVKLIFYLDWLAADRSPGGMYVIAILRWVSHSKAPANLSANLIIGQCQVDPVNG